MSNWASVIREVLLRGNFFAGDNAAIAASYDTASFSQASITANGGEYSFNALVDSILDAHAWMVKAIGENRNSEHRRWFQDVTASIANGGLIPTTGVTSKPRFGVISDVKDASDGRFCTEQPRAVIDICNRGHSRVKSEKYYFYSDDVRIFHSRINVVAEIVTWDRAAERSAIIANNGTAQCSMPEGLLPDLINGSLATIYRDTFRFSSAMVHWQVFAESLNRIAGKQIASLDLIQKV